MPCFYICTVILLTVNAFPFSYIRVYVCDRRFWVWQHYVPLKIWKWFVNYQNYVRNLWVNFVFGWNITLKRGWSTCKSDSMPSKLLSRLRSIVSPFRSSSICSKMPSTVRFWTALSLTMWVRKSSNPVSLQHIHISTSNTNSTPQTENLNYNTLPDGREQGVLKHIGTIQEEKDTSDHYLQ